jgi:hypothetical protein
MPAGASSNTTHRWMWTPRSSAARREPSGSGLPLATLSAPTRTGGGAGRPPRGERARARCWPTSRKPSGAAAAPRATPVPRAGPRCRGCRSDRAGRGGSRRGRSRSAFDRRAARGRCRSSVGHGSLLAPQTRPSDAHRRTAATAGRRQRGVDQHAIEIEQERELGRDHKRRAHRAREVPDVLRISSRHTVGTRRYASRRPIAWPIIASTNGAIPIARPDASVARVDGLAAVATYSEVPQSPIATEAATVAKCKPTAPTRTDKSGHGTELSGRGCSVANAIVQREVDEASKRSCASRQRGGGDWIHVFSTPGRPPGTAGGALATSSVLSGHRRSAAQVAMSRMPLDAAP